MLPVDPARLVEKRALRRSMRERRASVAPAERARASDAACARLTALPELTAPRGRVVAGFSALPAELDPAAALAAIRQAGGTIAYPRVRAGAPRLCFHPIADPAALRPGAFAVLEPPEAAPEIPVEAIDVLLLPGLAFDARGHRLGYGGGYYDEVAARLRSAGRGVLVGFAFDFQIVSDCPAADGDVPVDRVVTDARVLRCRGPGAPAAETKGPS